MAHRLAPEAEADLDAIWFYVAKETASPETAARLIDTITERFVLLSTHPHIGRSREDLRSGRGSVASTIVKMAVFVPMPSANVRTAAAAKPG